MKKSLLSALILTVTVAAGLVYFVVPTSTQASWTTHHCQTSGTLYRSQTKDKADKVPVPPNCSNGRPAVEFTDNSWQICAWFIKPSAKPVPDYSWNDGSKTVSLWLSASRNWCGQAIYEINWGQAAPPPAPAVTGYYCNRADPAKPTYQPSPSPTNTTTEYQCSLACSPQSYEISITTPDEPWRSSWKVGETIRFLGEVKPLGGLPEVGRGSWL